MTRLRVTKSWPLAAAAAVLILVAPSPGRTDTQIADAGAKAAGGVYPFALEARNASCSEPQDFRFEPKNAPWLKLPQGNVARQVAQGETRSLPAQLDFTNSAPGRYTAQIDVVCDTCGWFIFRSCYIDKQTILLRVDVTPAPTGAVAGAPGLTAATRKPQFSCCEKDIKITAVTPAPKKTQQRAGGFLIEVEIQLKISLTCTVLKQKDCLAYYEVSIKDSDWEELKGGKWVTIDPVDVSESVIPDPNDKLKWPCDGMSRSGVWTFTYFAEFSTKNPVRSTKLVFDLDVPADKGDSYEAEFEVYGVSGNTGEKPPAVKKKEVKKKKKK